MAGSPSPPREWLRKARQDLRSARLLSTSRGLSGPACFHAQQAVEKALKAVAAHLGATDIPRTHSLLELAQLISDWGGQTPWPLEELAGLDRFAVDVRYPRAPEPGPAAADKALRMAQRVCRWARQQTRPRPRGGPKPAPA